MNLEAHRLMSYLCPSRIDYHDIYFLYFQRLIDQSHF